MTLRPGLARLHKLGNPHIYCDIYTCNRPGAYILEHREGIFGTDHLILCKECAEALLLDLPEELDKVVHPPVEDLPLDDDSFISYVDKLLKSDIMAAIKADPKSHPGPNRAMGRLADMLMKPMPQKGSKRR